MAEREGNEILPESERIKQELFNYLGDAELGDAKFLAAFNIAEERRLQERVDSSQRKLLNAEDPHSRLQFRTGLFEAVLEQAFLNREIGGYKAKMPGYREAYQTIMKSFDKLGDAASFEAAQKYPNDEKKRDLEFSTIYYSGWNWLTHEFYYGKETNELR